MNMFAPTARLLRRRNALVPLPLLPPVPHNAIVTSVKIVHNQSAASTDPVEFANSTSWLNPFLANPSSPYGSSDAVDFTPPAKRPRLATRRRSSQSSAPACPAQTPELSSTLLNQNKKPRSTIVVTVRMANPAPTTGSHAALSPAPRHRRNVAAAVAPSTLTILRQKFQSSPRISSPLVSTPAVSSVDVADPLFGSPAMPSTATTPIPRSWSNSNYVRKAGTVAPKSKKTKKNGGRLGMLRWATLNNSGPEVGRRILSMGAKLAQEVWEAEQILEGISVEEDEMENQSGENMDISEAMEFDVEEQEQEQLKEEEVDTVMATEPLSSFEETAENPTTTTQMTQLEDKEENTPTPPTTSANNMEIDFFPKSIKVKVQYEIAVQVVSKKLQKAIEQPQHWFDCVAL